VSADVDLVALVRELCAIIEESEAWHTSDLRRVALEYRRAGWREGYAAATEHNSRDVARALQWREAQASTEAIERRRHERPELIHAAWDAAGLSIESAA
jgi:hypothetical protein